MMKIVVVLVVALSMAAGIALAAGGKNRLSEIRTDIDELYLLCERAGVQDIVIEADDVTVTLVCQPAEPAPLPAQ
jgi:hypothetical protein